MVINIIILFFGLGTGAGITWLIAARFFKANLAAEKTRFEEQRLFIEQAQWQLRDTFGNLSAEALRNNNESFVQIARPQLEEKIVEARGELGKKEQAIDALVKPLSASLEKMDTKIHQLEANRIKAYSDIWNYLDQVKTTTEG